MNKIAVFGTGIVGRVIAARLQGLGHEVMIGTRDVSRTLGKNEKDGRGNASFGNWYEPYKEKILLGTFTEAARHGDIIFNCTAGENSIQALTEAGEPHLRGKVLLDVSNPLDFSTGMPPTLSVCNTDSLAEVIQRTFPMVKVVKTLNTMTSTLMVNPDLVPGDHNVFVSGDEPEAKRTARQILISFGWKERNIIDLGDITTARGTEQLLPMWLRLWGKFQTPMLNFHIVLAAND